MAGGLRRRVSRLYALVLAAGSGSRFGGGKLMTPWRGGVLLDGALGAARAAPVADVLVVSGADPRVRAHAERRDFQVIDSPDHALGLSASLKAGVTALPDDAAGVLVFLGDMPSVPHAVLAPLAAAVEAGAPAAAPEFEGRLGNPAALSSVLFPRIMALDGDKGARGLLEGLGDRLARIPSPDGGVLLDIDRPSDLPT